MTDNSKTLIAALLDRSGSMSASKAATEEGFNGLILEQVKQPGQALVTLAQFDSYGGNAIRQPAVFGQGFWGEPQKYEGFKPEYLYEFKDITSVPKLKIEPRGGTPLLDAIGNFVTKVGADLAKMREVDRPDTVLVVVLTDGQENMSQAWNRSRVKDLIRQQEDVYKWRFLFLGSNIDAVAEGASMGFREDSSLTYNDDAPVAVAAAFSATSDYISLARSGNLASAGYSTANRSAANQE